ncbi:hypothetical protein U9M48_043853 [Paspalum notatum var. saurae]|uniref:Reverse transcriptase zinc-binding domain-containing protein n=1 Tax=Paspalum notatum var. saurae TaxID=547442 RepID=A0AAQ3UTY1_PASNO
MGFRWQIRDGKRVKFWEDNWSSTFSLATQFWNLYVVVNEKSGTVADLWDGENLKCTFRRTVSDALFNNCLWELKVPPQVHFFLWLLVNNKVLTRDNLGKRKKLQMWKLEEHGNSDAVDLEDGPKLNNALSRIKKTGALLSARDVEGENQEGSNQVMKDFRIAELKI